MVETVTALPIAQGASGSASTQGLEPGTEIKARVEANLPGGVIRLATADARIELRASAPLPPGAEVTVAVSGSKQLPEIRITLANILPKAPPPAIQPEAAGQASSGAPPPTGSNTILRADPTLTHLVQTFSTPDQAGGPGSVAARPVQAPGAQPPLPGSPQAAGPSQGGAVTGSQPQAPAASTQQGGAAQSAAGNPSLSTAAPVAAGQGAAATVPPVSAQSPQATVPGGQTAQGGGNPVLPPAAGQATAGISTASPAGTQAPQASPSAPQVGNSQAPSGQPPVLSGQPAAGATLSAASTATGAQPGAGQTVQGGVAGQGPAPAAVQLSSASGQGLAQTPTGAPAPGTQTAAQPGHSAGAATRGALPETPLSRAIPAQPYPAAAGGTARPSPAGETVPAGKSALQLAAAVVRQPLTEQQAGLGGMFAQVGALVSAQAAGQVSLPDTVAKAMQQILGLRLNPATSTPTGKDLQQAVRLSGQFSEVPAMRPGGSQQPLPDLKSALLSLKTLLQQLGAEPQVTRPAGQPAVPSRHAAPQGQTQQTASSFLAGNVPRNLQSLLQEVDSALARMRLTQLVNSGLAGDDRPQTAGRPMDLVLELPLALGQETAVMQMQIGRDGGGQDGEEETEPAWRLRFALDLTATGPLEAAISLRGGGTYTSLWVDRRETFDKLNALRDTMEAAFADAGLDLQELRLIRGLPPATAARYGALIDRQS
ncbi:flagellar hook-length control protein FliK [Labrenzia sp. OB1]|uniref:flagellar hook-length control protein FliK n=1 Tax=Labrenzia sp. OB1 TaxID=1561204 RepID=UPI0007B2C2F3|nr:flagellar hook-length control protein FliK [Labrenzia sp. OB1]KZM47542.1 hypothetical protein OA90_25410 [Labrenzia sp. OB1]